MKGDRYTMSLYRKGKCVETSEPGRTFTGKQCADSARQELNARKLDAIIIHKAE